MNIISEMDLFFSDYYIIIDIFHYTIVLTYILNLNLRLDLFGPGFGFLLQSIKEILNSIFLISQYFYTTMEANKNTIIITTTFDTSKNKN